MARKIAALGVSASMFGLLAPALAHAQTTEPKPAASRAAESGSDNALMEEIIVTATKKGAGERVQDVPAAITAYGADQLEALQVRSLESLTASMPNVQFDTVGTQKGVANFTIRGLGINSSIPSIEPTVGTFIDGIYLGTNFGVVLDTFDLESIEVLRGPQGVLFGRNVTGGAVLIRTARPTKDFKISGKFGVESGPSYTGALSVGGQVTEGVLAKIAGYYNRDTGYFPNVTTGRRDGKGTTWYIRPTVVLEPSDNVDFTMIAEHGESSGDGPINRNPNWAPRFKVASNVRGYTDYEVNSFTTELNVRLGNGGTITNLAGYRKLSQGSQFDPDGSPQNNYVLAYDTSASQFSNELRYAGTVAGADVVTGVYYFTQDVRYITDEALPFAARRSIFGGTQNSYGYAAFANADIPLVADQVTLGIGLRASHDKKRAEIATRNFTTPIGPCPSFAGPCRNDFADSATFNSFIPRVSLKYQPTRDFQVYGYYSKGARSGGYNLRSATNSPLASPGPFQDEKLDSFEVGLKTDLFDRRLRLNFAAFHTTIKDMQREQTIFTTAAFTNITNAADARTQGLEGEASLIVAKGLILRGNFGYVDGKYTAVRADLNSDLAIDARDKALKLPRLAPWTYGGGIFYDGRIDSIGGISANVNYNHRDTSFFDEGNRAPLPAFNNVNASISLNPNGMGNTRFTAYVKNLTNVETYGLTIGLATLPSGGSIRAIGKGVVWGGDVSFSLLMQSDPGIPLDKARAVDVIVVGAGFAGLYALHKLRGMGFSVQGFEIGDDVGGTWYWNRYPGARCDVESVDYSFSFDPALEQEWEWTERFATQPEILRYLNHVADRFDLRPLIRFGTRIERAQWSADANGWSVTTHGGETCAAQFLILATGSLSAAKAPDIAGVGDFAGPVLMTSSWPEGVDFTGQRVGVIGTGSSAIQAIPCIAEQAAQLTVFQRTPSFTIPARNAPLTRDYVAALKRRYAGHRAEGMTHRTCTILPSTGQSALAVSEAERHAAYEDSWTRGGPGLAGLFTDTLTDPAANQLTADFVRAKIRETVKDPETAETLVPRDYPIGSKRIAVDTDYYATFNRPNVTLIDLRRTPLERIVPGGVQTSVGVIAIDTLVLATGFDAMTGSFLRVGVETNDGRTLAETWVAGPRTWLGLMVAGFPNMFLVAGPGSPSVLSNMVCSIEQHVEWISALLDHMRGGGAIRVEADADAEEAWVDRVNQAAADTLFMAGDSWYLGANVPGKPRVFMPFVGGVPQYREICDEVAAQGYPGLAFIKPEGHPA